MPACGNCGSHVSTRYHRVFVPEGGALAGCPSCDGAPVEGGA